MPGERAGMRAFLPLSSGEALSPAPDRLPSSCFHLGNPGWRGKGARCSTQRERVRGAVARLATSHPTPGCRVLGPRVGAPPSPSPAGRVRAPHAPPAASPALPARGGRRRPGAPPAGSARRSPRGDREGAALTSPGAGCAPAPGSRSGLRPPPRSAPLARWQPRQRRPRPLSFSSTISAGKRKRKPPRGGPGPSAR